MSPDPQPLRILFAGTPAFAATQLEALHADALCELIGVCTQPDRPAGRGQRVSACAVKRWRQERAPQMPLLQPERLDAAALDAWRNLRPEMVITAAYGLILPPEALMLPPLGCMNVHASLLPRWRGAAPIQRAIAAGDTETGITLMRMDEGLDSGPILARRQCPIAPDDTAIELERKLAALGAQMLGDALRAEIAGTLSEQAQQGASCYARKIERAETYLDWERDAATLERWVRALYGKEYARCRLGDDTMKIHAACAEPCTARAPAGEILALDDEGILVRCADGALRLRSVLMPGAKRALNGRELLNGYARRLAPGRLLDDHD